MSIRCPLLSGRPATRHLQDVVMPVSVRVVAFAEERLVLLVAEGRIVQPMRRGKFEFLAEANHGKLPGKKGHREKWA